MKIKENFIKAKEAIKQKAEDAKDFYSLHRSQVNAMIAAFVGGTVGTVLITKRLSKSEGSEDENDDDKYYDCTRVFNIDGKKISGLYQRLGKNEAAIWFDPQEEDLDRHFRDDE